MTGFRLHLGQGARGPVSLPARYANRHGLVAGATGTGKTTTLATMAEGFSRMGVPVLAVDVKGDLAGLVRANPGELLDPFGETGRPARLNVWRLGSDLIARALELSDAQAGALDVAFAVAEAQGLALDTLADLRALLALCAAESQGISETVGYVTPSSLAVVQRAALRLERDAAGAFGARAAGLLDVGDLEGADGEGRGPVRVLIASRLAMTPGLYGALCAYVLTDLYRRAPEVGDLDRPRLALFLDESHLIFDGAPAALVRSIETIVRLIRSKGVAVFFITQSPADLPAPILAQLGARVQHGLRGATPADLRGIRAAADSMPIRRGLDSFAAIANAGVGEALVSVVGDDGRPTPADLVRIARPRARLDPLSALESAALRAPPPVAVVTVEPMPAAALVAPRRTGFGATLARLVGGKP